MQTTIFSLDPLKSHAYGPLPWDKRSRSLADDWSHLQELQRLRAI